MNYPVLREHQEGIIQSIVYKNSGNFSIDDLQKLHLIYSSISIGTANQMKPNDLSGFLGWVNSWVIWFGIGKVSKKSAKN